MCPRAVNLATALATERAIVRRAVAVAREIDGGWLLRHPPLPDVWHLNRVHLTGEAGGLDAAAVEALVEGHLAGVPHRRLTLEDPDAADAVWPELEDRDWRRERWVVMVRSVGRVAPGSAAIATRVLGAAELVAFQELALADDAGGSARSRDLAGRLAEAQAVLRTGTDWRAFGAGTTATGLPASTATLYLDRDVGGRRVAFVDQVATLRAYRQRGLARATIISCLRTAAARGVDLVALFADADDWPQVFYASLGFTTVGLQTVFHRDL